MVYLINPNTKQEDLWNYEKVTKHLTKINIEIVCLWMEEVSTHGIYRSLWIIGNFFCWSVQCALTAPMVHSSLGVSCWVFSMCNWLGDGTWKANAPLHLYVIPSYNWRAPLQVKTMRSPICVLIQMFPSIQGSPLYFIMEAVLHYTNAHKLVINSNSLYWRKKGKEFFN